MNALMMNPKSNKFASFVIHAIRVTFADAILYAVCGALYGMVLAGFGAQVRHQFSLSGIFSIAGNCAMVGFAVGAAVGAFSEVMRARNLRRRLSDRATRTALRFAKRPQADVPEVSMKSVSKNALIVVAGKGQPRIAARVAS